MTPESHGHSKSAMGSLAAPVWRNRVKWLVPCLLVLAMPVFSQTNTPAAHGDPVAERNVAGTVELIEGEVRVFDTAKAPRSVAKGNKVYEGESIVTGRDGEVHLSMEDSGFIGVRPNTRMRFTKHQANGEATDTSVIGLLAGAMRSVTGWIGKDNMSAYQIRTPTATVGVRGTDHETLVIPQGQGNADAGTYDNVNFGGTFLQTKHGKVNVEPNRAGFASYRAGSRPQLLERVPHFFKPTRHESVFQGKHAAIQKVIKQRREEKHKLWQEKAARRQAAKTGRRDQPREKREAERQKHGQERQKAVEERKGQKEERQQRHEAHQPAEPQKRAQDRDK